LGVNGAVYLDYNAGAPVRPQAAQAMAQALSRPGNPSSVHAFGRAARATMEGVRATLARLVGGDPRGVIFTSGGTEANNLALCGTGRRRRLVSAVEHPSVLDAAPHEIIPVDSHGIVDPAALERLLAADPRPALISVMLANNETGVIQPLAELARISHAHGALVHCDAAQALGRIPVRLSELGADLVSISAHKLGGPSGVGALILTNPDMNLAPILLGGGQERRRRAGTENMAGIAGLGAALEQAGDELAGGDTILRVKHLRDRLEATALKLVPDAVVVGATAPRLPNTSCLALPGLAAQTQVMALDLDGVMVSAGAACSSGKVAESRVLAAQGLDGAIRASAIRVSLGWASAESDVDAFLASWSGLAARKGFRISRADAA
jgi:cysteine desulfurase